MRTSATNRKLRVLLTAIANGTLTPRPEFQRRLVWTNRDKLAFIKTVLEGYPFPEIYIAAGSVNPETGEGTEMLVDGQQRITTLFQYFKAMPDLRLDRETPPYSTLPDKMSFLEYEVVVRDLGQLDLESIKRIFQRINATNYSLNAMEIHNARFNGEFKQVGESLSEHDFFERHEVFSSAEIKRMQDVRFCLIFMTTMMETYFNRDEMLEEYLRKFNDEFEEGPELKNQITEVFSFVDACNFPQNSRVWKKADLFSVLVEVHRALFRDSKNLLPSHFTRELATFFAEVDSASARSDAESSAAKYYKATLQASNDRGSRIARGNALQLVITRATSEGSLL